MTHAYLSLTIALQVFASIDLLNHVISIIVRIEVIWP